MVFNPAGIVFRILCFRDALGVDIAAEDRLRRLGNWILAGLLTIAFLGVGVSLALSLFSLGFKAGGFLSRLSLLALVALETVVWFAGHAVSFNLPPPMGTRDGS